MDKTKSSKVLLSLKNSQGLTAMDIVERQGQMDIKDIKAMRSYAAKYEGNDLDYGSADFLKRKKSTFTKWAISSFRNNMLISDQNRTGVITAAILIATATYQAILSPPRGLWEADPNSIFSNGTSMSNVTNNISTTVHNTKVADMVGTSVLAEYQWYLFLIFNTTAFLGSMMKIIDLISGGTINAVLIVFPLVFCYAFVMNSIQSPQVEGATATYCIIIGIVTLLYFKEITKHYYITSCKRVVETLQLKHQPRECK